MKINATTLAGAIRSGRGIGVGDAYSPWTQITRNLSSPFSNLNLSPAPQLLRPTHYLSRGERNCALLLWWLGAVDVREQYPLWPWEHVHPEIQLGPMKALRYHPGMRELAIEAGIPLHNYPGSSIPTVLSIDLVATIPAPSGDSRLVGISCKPRSIFENGSPTDREIERLELDRRYCLHAAIPFRLAHPEEIPRDLIRQLHWLVPVLRPLELAALANSLAYEKYVERFAATAYNRPVYVASREAGKHAGLTGRTEQMAMTIALWRQDVDADLSRTVNTSAPLQPGGISLRTRLAAHWLGATK